jgi:hypothetical protein
MYTPVFPLIGISQTGPGGVKTTDGMSSLVLWLDANNGTTLSGSNVTVWNDLSGYGNNATPPSVGARPTFVSSIVNGYPSVDFDGSNDELRIADNASIDLTSWEIIVVTKADVNKDYNAILIKGTDAQENYEFLSFSSGLFHYPIVYTTGARTLLNSSTGQYSTSNFDVFEYAYSSAVGRDVLKNNNSILTDNENRTPLSNNNPLYIGNELGTSGRFLDGDIAEIIIYNTRLNAAEEIIIQNYLAAKYNRSLSTIDIYNEDDAGAGNYDHQVAGIGRVDASNIQNDAQGVGIVRVLNPTGLGNDEFLIWGHDNGVQQATETTDVPATVQARFDRVWRVSEVNTSNTAVDVGAIDIYFDLAGLGTVTATDLRLLVDTDNDGLFNDETPISGASNISGDVYGFSGVTAIANNLRFTLATINSTQTYLPIELLNFNAKATNENTVQINWQTASEINNDYFTIEKSKDGLNWKKLIDIDGAGNSSALLSYESIDRFLLMGISYYRLKQTDFDGQFSYSQIRSVQINKPINSSVTIYPNPVENEVTIVGNSLDLDQIKIINALGQNVTSFTKIISNEESKLVIDLSKLTIGIYFIKTKTTANKVYKQ